MSDNRTLAECMDDLRNEFSLFGTICYGIWYGYYVKLVLWHRRRQMKLIARGIPDDR